MGMLRSGSVILAAGTTLAVAACGPSTSRSPELVAIHTSDVDLFWTVLDSADAAARRGGRDAPALDDLARRLERDYLAAGTEGLRDFVPGRILGGEELARRILARRADYEDARSHARRLREVEPEVRAVFRRLQALHPAAVFPDVYFVVGGFNSGGTTSAAGLLIGAEMVESLDDHAAIVAHELVHYQQPDRFRPTLLTQSLHEGTAEFVGERIAGRPHRSPRYAYGLAHETALWERFQRVMGDRDFGGWIYGGQAEGVPADLGYFLGYRIVEAYWNRAFAGAEAPDSSAVLAEILTWDDAEAFLRASGYRPGELSRVLAGARRAVGLDRPLAGIVAEAEVTAPDGSFGSEVASWVDGAASVKLPGGSGLRVPGHDPWGREERIAGSATGEPRARARGHELHALALFPETRLADPVYLGPARFQGRPALAVRWRVDDERTLSTFYARSDTVPVGARMEWTDPPVEVWFHGWSRVEDGPFEGLRLFRGATFHDGEELYRYRFDRVEPRSSLD